MPSFLIKTERWFNPISAGGKSGYCPLHHVSFGLSSNSMTSPNCCVNYSWPKNGLDFKHIASMFTFSAIQQACPLETLYFHNFFLLEKPTSMQHPQGTEYRTRYFENILDRLLQSGIIIFNFFSLIIYLNILQIFLNFYGLGL